MNYRSSKLLLLFPLCAVLNGFPLPIEAARFQNVASQHPPELAVLDNGQAIAGWITRSAEKVTIQTAQGSRVVLPARRVVTICHSLLEVYEYRFRHTAEDDSAAHVTLLHWCLKHKLQAAAEKQIDALMLTSLDASQLNYLNQQVTKTFATPVAKNHLDVELAFSPLPKLNESPSKADSSPTSQLSSRALQPALNERPETIQFPVPAPTAERDSAVVQVGYEEPASTSESGPVTAAQLNALNRKLHKDDLILFQRRVQPILLRGCSAANCHSNNAASLPLMQRGQGQLIPKRFSQRNLHQILQYLDPQQPSQSALLVAASVSHGGSEKPPLQVDSDEYRLLTNWVASLAMHSPGSLAAIKATTLQPKQAEIGGLSRSNRDSHTAATAVPTADPTPSVPRVAAIPDIGQRGESFRPLDAFDPEIFHRLIQARHARD